jgi:chemotaxis protein methyltransferase CheR
LTSEIRPQDIEAFRSGLARRLGLHFDESKSAQLGEVLQQRLRETALASSSYLASLERGGAGDEISALARALTVGETYFFRNLDQFRALAQAVWPERMRVQAQRKSLRMLSAGCASGEEAFSMAILARESLDPSWEVSIRAIDVNPAALAKAARGRFTSWALREAPAAVISRWFREDGRELVLDEGVRAQVRFEARNLAADDPDIWLPSSYDVVFCRNVLMYFTPQAAQAVVARIARALAPGGYLFLGHAETLRGLSQQFHLCHTHDTFYYQLKQGASDQPLPPLAPTPFAAGPPPGSDDGWVDAIRRAAERIQALSTGPSQTPAPTPAPNAEPPRPPPLDLARALELLQKERFNEALEVVRAFPELAPPDRDVMLLHAVLLSHNAELGQAEALCQKLLELDELNAGAHYVLALCREGAGDLKAALEHDQVATYLAPGFAMPRLHLGLLARRAGDWETARRELGQALVLLEREDASRILLFGGGFQRSALLALCRAELQASGGYR